MFLLNREDVGSNYVPLIFILFFLIYLGFLFQQISVATRGVSSSLQNRECITMHVHVMKITMRFIWALQHNT
jgi:hypothetical protein